ncbi:MAG: hypothetical protein ACJAYA_000550 [Bacteroidia bacterium]|jgi:hypothetical protein
MILRQGLPSSAQPVVMKHISLFAFVLYLNTFAQQTGDYTVTIATSDPSLNGDSLDIYFHVPDTRITHLLLPK